VAVTSPRSDAKYDVWFNPPPEPTLMRLNCGALYFENTSAAASVAAAFLFLVFYLRMLA
jgi:hypothetical protein